MVWEGDNTTYEVTTVRGTTDFIHAANVSISPNGDLTLYDSQGGVKVYAAGQWLGVSRA